MSVKTIYKKSSVLNLHFTWVSLFYSLHYYFFFTENSFFFLLGGSKGVYVKMYICFEYWFPTIVMLMEYDLKLLHIDT